MKKCLTLFLTAISFMASSPISAQNLQDFISDYNKPTKMQHMDIEGEKNNSGMKHFTITDDDKGEDNPRYVPDNQSAITNSGEVFEDLDEQQRGFSYKSTGVVLNDDEHFPELASLAEWPWLKELTYGLENAATQNAMQIMDRDLSKAPPLAMIWAAQHYYDMKQRDKALFLYLGSRLRSSVDQARFRVVARKDVSASNDNTDVERMAGQGAESYDSFKDLSAYNAIAASIGRPILRYGLKNPAAYKKQLSAAMQWDAETPYEYLPSVNDLELSEDNKESWSENYKKIRDVYYRQMLKIVGSKAK